MKTKNHRDELIRGRLRAALQRLNAPGLHRLDPLIRASLSKLGLPDSGPEPKADKLRTKLARVVALEWFQRPSTEVVADFPIIGDLVVSHLASVGDPLAFSYCMNRLLPEVTRQMRRQFGPMDDVVEQLLSEVICSMTENPNGSGDVVLKSRLAAYEGKTPLVKFVTKAVKNLFLSRIRHETAQLKARTSVGRERRTDAYTQTDESTPLSSERVADALVRAIESLPERSKHILLGSIQNKVTQKELAQSLQISETRIQQIKRQTWKTLQIQVSSELKELVDDQNPKLGKNLKVRELDGSLTRILTRREQIAGSEPLRPDLLTGEDSPFFRLVISRVLNRLVLEGRSPDASAASLGRIQEEIERAVAAAPEPNRSHLRKVMADGQYLDDLARAIRVLTHPRGSSARSA